MYNHYEKTGVQETQLIKLFNSLFNEIDYYDYKSKFQTLKYILNNNLISTSDREKLWFMFYRAQYIYSNINILHVFLYHISVCELVLAR